MREGTLEGRVPSARGAAAVPWWWCSAVIAMPVDTPLHKAANNGDIEACKTLIQEEKMDVNAPGAAERTALQRAAGGNHIDLTKVLIDLGANVNQKDKAGRTALHWAAIAGHQEPIKILLQHGADYNIANSSGSTCLINAVENGKLEVVTVLLDHHVKVGAGEAKGEKLNMDAKDESGKTAMDWAKEKKMGEVEFMLKEGRPLKPGETPPAGCVIC